LPAVISTVRAAHVEALASAHSTAYFAAIVCSDYATHGTTFKSANDAAYFKTNVSTFCSADIVAFKPTNAPAECSAVQPSVCSANREPNFSANIAAIVDSLITAKWATQRTA
jgi:hypothetical protein